MTNEEQAAILSGRALGFSDGITKEKYDIAMKMAQWKDQEFAKQKQALIDKTCSWLENIIFDKVDALFYDDNDIEFVKTVSGKEFADIFRKSMEETK